MKNNLKIQLVVALIFCANIAYAAGTPAGTFIQSRSMVVFTAASTGETDTVYSNYVGFYVAQLASINLTPPANSIVTASDSVNADYPITIINSGNGSDVGRLSAVSARGYQVQMYFDANGDGVLQSGELSGGTITQTASLAADAQYRIIARVKIPRDESLNGVKDSTTVIVKSNFDSSKTNSGLFTTTVQTARLGINSSLSVSNSSPTIGSNVIYTLSFTNTGSVPATGMTIYDLIGNGYTFVSGTATQGAFSGGSVNPVSWNIGSVSPGTTVTITLTLLVNSSNTIGANLTDSMTVSYTVGSNNYIVGTNSPAVIVGGNFGVQVVPFSATATKEPTDTVAYRFKVVNSGSVKDVIEIQSSSTRNWNWRFYRDANNNLLWDGTDPLLTNTNSSQSIDVDSVAAGDSVRIFAVVANIPRTKTNTVKDTLQVRVISSIDNSKQNFTSAITAVNEPLVVINISSVPNQPAGAVVTYSIAYSNIGSAPANNFSIVDAVPNFTEYIPNSVILNGTAIQDNAGQLSVTDGQNGNKVISVSIGTLNVQANGSVEFKVKIK